MADVMKALMLTPADGPALTAVAELIAAAVGRREALGLAAPLSAGEYRQHIESLLQLAATGDAGLSVVVDGRGGVLGTAQWTRSPYRTRRVLAEIDRVCVAPSARGQGVGRTLVESVAGDAADHGVEVVGLEVRGNNHAAIALYEQCGFGRGGLIPNAVAEENDRYDIVLMYRGLARPTGVRLVGSEPVGIGASTVRR